MSRLDRQLLEGLWDRGVRIGTLIHVAGATVDIEAPSEPMESFLEDHAHESYVRLAFEPMWPGYGDSLDSFERGYEATKRDCDRRTAEQLWKEELAGYFARHCPKQLLVGVEYQVVRCLVADPEGEGLGTWRAGWGHYGTRWMLVDDVVEAARAGLELASEHRRAEWQQAINEGRVFQPKPVDQAEGGDR